MSSSAPRGLVEDAAARGLPLLASVLASRSFDAVPPQQASPDPLEDLAKRRPSLVDFESLVSRAIGVERALLACDAIQQVLFRDDQVEVLRAWRRDADRATLLVDESAPRFAFAENALTADAAGLAEAIATIGPGSLLLGNLRGAEDADDLVAALRADADPAMAEVAALAGRLSSQGMGRQFSSVARAATWAFHLAKLTALASTASVASLRLLEREAAIFDLIEMAGDQPFFAAATRSLGAATRGLRCEEPAALYLRGRILKDDAPRAEITAFVDDATRFLKTTFKLAPTDQGALDALTGARFAGTSDFEIVSSLIMAIADRRLLLGEAGSDLPSLYAILARRPLWKYGFRTVFSILTATRGDEGIALLDQFLAKMIATYGIDFQLSNRFLRYVEPGSQFWQHVADAALRALQTQRESRECWAVVARTIDATQIGPLVGEVGARIDWQLRDA